MNLNTETGRKFAHNAFWSSFIIMWALTFYLYRLLPDLIPIHFNISGTPTNWGSAEMLFLLPGAGTFIMILLLGINKLVDAAPYLVNLPTKKQQAAFITLDNDDRKPILDYMKGVIIWMLLPLNLLWIYGVIATYLVASDKMYGLYGFDVLTILIILFMIIIKLYFEAKHDLNALLKI